jgi:hypothetical protein
MSDALFTRSDRVVFRAVAGGDRGVLLHLDTGAYHQVNETGRVIWEELATPSSASDLASRVRSTFPDAPDALVDEVFDFLNALAQRGLVSSEDLSQPPAK